MSLIGYGGFGVAILIIQDVQRAYMAESLPTGLKILLGVGTVFLIIGVVYFVIGVFIAKESILSFDKGIAYFVIGIAVLVYTLLIITVVDLEEMKEQLDRIKKK